MHGELNTLCPTECYLEKEHCIWSISAAEELLLVALCDVVKIKAEDSLRLFDCAAR